MEFIKMHGLGNDFIFLDVMDSPAPENPADMAKKLCDRHFSIGGDGLVLLGPWKNADAEMRIFNPDGSEAEMCGNALRCAAKYLYESGRVGNTEMVIHTLAGEMPARLTLDGARVTSVSVDMGLPRVTGRCDLIINGVNTEFLLISTGNPHAVTFTMYPTDDIFKKYAPRIETNPIFPEGTNVEFCRLDSPSHITVRVWERGVGPTLACGTGATASFFAGVKAGILETKITVSLPGGDLEYEMTKEGRVIMTGPAETAFKGHI